MTYKNVLLLLLLAVLSGISLHAQDYRPFLPGRLHYFASGTNYSVRIDSAGTVGSDSTYWMNAVTRAGSGDCIANNHTHFVPGQEGLFGDHWIHRADGAFLCVSLGGDTATFHTQLPTGTPWDFLSDSTITASISLRGQIPVGTTLDSMLVIDLSDGRQYRLTQHHGLYLGPNLSYYFGMDTLRFSTLASVPEVPDFKAYWGWDVGDNFTVSDIHSGNWEKYDRYEVLERGQSMDGDSLWFRVKHRHAEQWSGLPDTVLPPDTLMLHATRARYPYLELATGEPHYTAQGYHCPTSWEYDPEYFGRRTQLLTYFGVEGLLDSCGYSHPLLASPCVWPMPMRYTLGVGATHWLQEIGWTMTSCVYSYRDLVCYMQAGMDSLGPCPPMAMALGRAEGAQPAPKVGLVAARGGWQVAWQGLQPGHYRWQYYDLHGRLLRQVERAMPASGDAEVEVAGAPGMYLLRIGDMAGTWAHTLRIPKPN